MDEEKLIKIRENKYAYKRMFKAFVCFMCIQ